jgi:hypothetical protein
LVIGLVVIVDMLVVEEEGADSFGLVLEGLLISSKGHQQPHL